jgi:hypothetical protein
MGEPTEDEPKEEKQRNWPLNDDRSHAAKEKRRRTVARGILGGQRTKDIARSAGTTPRTGQRLAAEPETRRLIADLLKPHWKRLETP